LIIKDLAIIDNAPYEVDTASLDCDRQRIFRCMRYRPVDTLFAVGNLTATFSLNGLLGKGIRLQRVYIRDVRLNLVVEENGHSINITRMFRIPEKQHKDVEDKDIFLIRNADIENMRFTLKNYRVLKCHDIDTSGINWNDLDISDLEIHARNLALKGKVMSGTLDYTSFNERSGYSVDHVSGRTVVGNGEARIDDIRLVDPWSDVDIPHFSMRYAQATDFAHFMDGVRITAEIQPTDLNRMTLSYFAPKLGHRELAVGIRHGFVDGTVDSLTVSNLDLSLENGAIKGVIDASTRGLPDLKKLTARAEMKNLRFSTAGAQRLMSALGKSGADLGKYASGVGFTLNGSVFGRPDDMKFNGYIRSDSAGSLVADLRVTGLMDRMSETVIGGTIRTSALNLHRLMDRIPAEQCTADAVLTARLGSRKATAKADNNNTAKTNTNKADNTNTTDNSTKANTNNKADNDTADNTKANTADAENDNTVGPSLRIDSLKVSSLRLNGYDYSNVAAAGTIADHRFDGKIVCNDPNLNFLFQGLLTVSGKTNNALYRFYANIGHANLNALNIDRRGRSEVDLKISANFTRTGAGVWLGEINLADIGLVNSVGRHDVGNVRIESFVGNDLYQMRFGSKFAEGTFSGSASITKFFSDVVSVTARRELPALFRDASYERSGESYRLSFRTFNTADLLSFFAPGVYVAEGTSVKVSLDGDGLLDGQIRSQRLAYRERYVKDLALTIGNSGGRLTGALTGESIDLSPLMIRDNRFEITAKDDTVRLNLKYDNIGDRGEFIVRADIGRPSPESRPTVDISLLPSTFRVNAKDWNILPAEIRLEGNTLSVNRFKIYSNDESISAQGKLSDNIADTLDVDVRKFDLSILNALAGDDLAASGRLSGRARITSPKEARRLLLDFRCDSAGIAGERIGDLSLATKWEDTFNKFHVLAANSLDGRTTFSLNGTYTPSIRQLDVMARLKEFSLSYATPVLKGV
ncbi:MAG: hypothetical protein LUD50_00165, partial [Clostridia bacterium]|nr:hypothetical protein [Clostridia bacterium]